MVVSRNLPVFGFSVDFLAMPGIVTVKSEPRTITGPVVGVGVGVGVAVGVGSGAAAGSSLPHPASRPRVSARAADPHAIDFESR